MDKEIKEIFDSYNITKFDDIFKFSRNASESDKEKMSKDLAKEIVDKWFFNFDTDELFKKAIKAIKMVAEHFEEVEKIRKKLEQYESLADGKTKIKLEKMMKSKFTNIEEFRKELEEIENDIKYIAINENKEVNQITNDMGKFKEDTCIVDLFADQGTIKTDKLEYKIENFGNIKTYISISTSKLFIYAIYNLDYETNKSNFTFTDYAKFRGIARDKENREKIQKDLKVLKAISNITVEDKKKHYLLLDSLLYKGEYDRGNISIEFNPEFTKGLKDTYMYFPKKLMKMNGKENKNVFLLGWYLFTLLRMNRNKVSIKNCLNQTSLIKHNEVKDSKYKQLIIEPFDKIINTLSFEIDDIELNYESGECPTDINNFLEENIIISFKNNKIINLYQDNKTKKLQKSIKYNKSKKDENIKICKTYLKEGKSKNQIAKTLNKSVKTIERYIQEINSQSQ